ncbi:MAG: ATP synthase F1 subunit gamma [Chloroflexi bacterium]|nr:ATP synthase F1 subunit gamma [Chloroflexota bacterium]
MANIRLIKRRIRSLQNTAKITKAMEMIAASKMRRTQMRALAARPYAQRVQELLSHLAAMQRPDEPVHPLLEQRPVKKVAIVHFAADRGLCGGMNANVNRRTLSLVKELDKPVSVVAVGRRGRDFAARYLGNLTAEFTGLGDKGGIADIHPIAHLIIEDYIQKAVDRVYLVYPQFVSTAVQRPAVQTLLPVEPAHLEHVGAEYIWEPESPLVLAALLPRYIEMQLYHAYLEEVASEQSARMVAMRNATDNANEIVGELTLAYNKARQEAITKELLDVVGGAAALGT